VRIDETHKKWLVISLLILVAATCVYIPYALGSTNGPSGGSAMGIAFGAIGFAFMIFAGLLGARKKVPVWRLGRAQAWMRGHLWLGLLALPIIAFHAGFRFGGPLTTALMALLIVVVASGLFGAALQHYMPSMMTSQVASETIFEQIDHVREQLLAEADRLAAAREETPLRSFYLLEMRPFLEKRGGRNQLLSNPDRARSAFEGLRTLLPADAHETTRSWEAICEEERQLRRQAQLHHWLHGWLLLHIPLSLALLVLGCVHAFVALRY